MRARPWSVASPGRGEQSNLRKDGAVIKRVRGGGPIRQPDGRITHYVELKAGRERPQAGCTKEIHRLAHYDSLTSLPNRSMLIERLASLQARHQRSATMCTSCCCWIWISSPAQRCPRQRDGRPAAVRRGLGGWPSCWAHDLLVRVAGDEFGIVLHDLGIDATVAGRRASGVCRPDPASLCAPLAGRLWRRGPAGFEHGPDAVPKGVDDAAGCHGARGHRIPGQACRRRPVGLLAGRAWARRRPALSGGQDLRHAIGAQNCGFTVQPQVNVRGQVTGVEALVRWQHPRDGLLTPGAFIPLAEVRPDREPG